MQASLVKYFHDYKINLTATKMNYEATLDRFSAIKQEINDAGTSKYLLRELSLLAKALFQSNYRLMEAHLAVQNLYSNYSKDDKLIIDEYQCLDSKVNRLITNIQSFQQSHKTKTNNNSLYI